MDKKKQSPALTEKNEIKKARETWGENINSFKSMVLKVSAHAKTKPSNDPLRLNVNRISDFQTEVPGETLEQWVARQKTIPKKKAKPSRSIMDRIEQWLINEAIKDLFKELNKIYDETANLSSESIRELGVHLISLADKMDDADPRKR
jgi:hypothetical protein